MQLLQHNSKFSTVCKDQNELKEAYPSIPFHAKKKLTQKQTKQGKLLGKLHIHTLVKVQKTGEIAWKITHTYIGESSKFPKS